MKAAETFNELINLSKSLDITVKFEKSNVSNGFCLVNGKKYIILDQNLPLNSSLKILISSLIDYGIDDIYIKPAIREFIDNQNLSTKKTEN